ncbi:MAG: acetylxylan esterase [Phycisphaerales bacterium]|nr:MAG: acetylxylan esterase [Phycisphaerales bacterium]
MNSAHGAVLALLSVTLIGPRAVSDDRWPPRHEIDETLAAEALQACGETWSDGDGWRERAGLIRTHLREVLNLDLDEPRPPVTATLHHRREFDDYAVSNVLLETAEGVYVAANFYEPLGREGPYPSVLCPHGHFRGRDDNPEGRFQHDYQRLCATLARMGAVVLAWDMVGWGETTYLPHGVPDTTILQTWNSIRAVDYVSGLPDVDETRIAMTGYSGGGTQTFLAACLDERVAAAAPVVMVSAHWFGGCPCESGLPVHAGPNHRTNNVEITACIAPRPLLLVSCGEDWTRNTPLVEYPYIRSVYEALGAADSCTMTHLSEEGHDYGPSKRAAACRFLARRLGLDLEAVLTADRAIDDAPVHILKRSELQAIDEAHPLPADAVADHAAALAAIAAARQSAVAEPR